MGVLDKFLNAMKMNDDEGFGDDYLDDDYDDYDEVEEERPKKRVLNKYNDDDYDDAPQPQITDIQERQPVTKMKPVKQPKSKVSPMRSTKRGTGMEVCVIKPKSLNDACEVAETLREECTVVLNVEGLDLDLAQRIIDVASGSCYALNGKLQRISNYIFIITPESVDISGDIQEILSGAFEVPSFGTRF